MNEQVQFDVFQIPTLANMSRENYMCSLIILAYRHKILCKKGLIVMWELVIHYDVILKQSARKKFKIFGIQAKLFETIKVSMLYVLTFNYQVGHNQDVCKMKKCILSSLS